jgi:cell division protein FtsW
MLLVFGLVMVYSASFVESFTNPDIQDSSYIFKRQLMLVGIGLVAFVVMLAIDYRSWNSIVSWLPWLLGVVLLILTWATGNEALGGKRWIDVFNFNLQPSEFTKVALLLLSAMLMVRLREEGNTRPLIIMTAVAVGLPALLILLQPDLGTTLIALVGVVAVAWFGELSMKPLAFVVLLIGLVGAGAIFLTDFRTARIDAWLDPWADPLDGGYQIVNALYAFAGGGTTGVGLGMSHQKYLYLSQAHNDLIFPIIGEEFGIVGTITVALLFLLFLFAAFRIARNAPDLYGRVIAGSAAGMIGFQAFLNMLCTVNILPMTGKPLPFFSAGGSSIIVTLMLVGLILNVSLRSKNADEARERRDQLLIIDGGRREMQGGRQPLSWPLGQSPARSLGQFLGQSARTRTAPSPSMASQGARPQAAASRATGSQLRGDTSSKERFRRQPERTQTAQKPLRRVPTRAGQAGAQAGVRSSLPLSSRQAAQAPAVSSQRAASPGAASPRDASQRTATRARVNPALGMSPPATVASARRVVTPPYSSSDRGAHADENRDYRWRHGGAPQSRSRGRPGAAFVRPRGQLRRHSPGARGAPRSPGGLSLRHVRRGGLQPAQAPLAAHLHAEDRRKLHAGTSLARRPQAPGGRRLWGLRVDTGRHGGVPVADTSGHP